MGEPLPAAESRSLGARARAMANRLAETARHHGLDDAGTARILDAYRAAQYPRDRYLDSDHHPDYLHPGRTALILMNDLGVRDPLLIAAGTLLESLRPELAGETDDAEIAALLAEIPTPGRDGERLAESLLLAGPEIRLVALAEWLDQVRHLHLHEPDEWERIHQETGDIYLPIAVRTDPTLARRYRWWYRTFEQRFLARRADGPGVD